MLPKTNQSLEDVLYCAEEASKVFSRFYPQGTVRKANSADIQNNAIKFFEGRSRLFIDPEDYYPGNFEEYFIIHHSNGDKTYTAEQTKIYPGDWSTEKLVYLFEVNNQEARLGDGELRFNITRQDSFFKDKPFVGWTRTEEQYRRLGLGIRRLRVMNALAQMLYGFPLNSSTTLVENSEGRWKALVTNGEARRYKHNGRNRYVFLSPSC